MGKCRLLWFRKLLPLNSLQRAYCFCIIIPNVSKSAFSQYLKHSQLPHKYHLYFCTAIQHIKEYHLQSCIQDDDLSLCMWAWNKDREQDKIFSPSRSTEDHVISLPSLTQDSRPLRALRVEYSPEVSWAYAYSRILLLGNSIVGEQLAHVLALPFVFIYLLCWKRPFLLI